MTEYSDLKRKRILALLFTGVLMGALDISIVGPAIPSIEKTLSVDEKSLTWIFSIYILFNLVGISLIARLSDIFGRRLMYMLSIGVFGAGSLYVALSPDINSLLIGRAIQGFGASGIFPVASATVGDIFPAEKRGRVLGLIGMVFGLAFIIGPLMAGILLSYFEWHVLFLINLPIAVVLIIGSYFLLPSEAVSKESKIDWWGILFLGLFLAGFSIGINKIEIDYFITSIFSTQVLPYFVVAFISLLLFVLVERKAKVPIVKLGLFKAKQVRIVGFLALGTGLYQASFVFIPDMTVDAFGVEANIASFMLLPVVVAIAIGSPISGRMIDKYGSKIIINIALILMTAGLIILHLLKDQYFVYYTSGILLGLGLSVLAGSSLRYIMLNEVSAEERAITQGVLTIFISIGQLVGAALIGAITTSYAGSLKGYKQSFLFLAVISVTLFVSSLWLKRKEDELKASS
ncbi:MFS transporter [Bacteroidota bacterium]